MSISNKGPDRQQQGLPNRLSGWFRGALGLLLVFLVEPSTFSAFPATELDPAKPPGLNFDLSHWYLTLPAAGPPILQPDQLTAGYTNAAWFYTGADGAMVFFAPVTGGTTTGSDYPRSELRERLDPTTNNVNWTVAGIHLLNARCRVLQAPSTGRIIIGQIHSYLGNAYPLVKLTYDNGDIDAVIKVSPNWSDETHHLFNAVGLNTAITYQIQLVDGVVSVTVNGLTRTVDVLQRDPDWVEQTFYFKAGSYCQDNVGPSSEGGRVAFTFLEVRHPALATLAPSIAVPPEPQSVPEGAMVTFDGLAGGAAPLLYQWLRNGTALAEATSPTLRVTNALSADAGEYRLVVSNAYGAVTSAVARLAVIPPPPLTLRAGSTNGLPGAQVLLPVVASQFTNINSFQFSLHWNPAHATFLGVEQFGVAGLAAGNFGTNFASSGLLTVSWDDASGTNQNVRDGTALFALRLELTGPPGSTGVVFIDGTPTAAEAANANLRLVEMALVPGRLSVNATLPVISTQPQGQTVGAGSNLTLNVAATGTAPMTYQWQLNGSNLADPLAFGSMLRLTNVRPAQAGAYSVVVGNAAGSVTSAVAAVAIPLSVAAALDGSGAVWTASGSTPLWAGQTVVTHDGLDAAQSGAIVDGKNTSLQTVILGPRTVSFWWKVSSETNNDLLTFYVNGSEKARISGEVDWRRQSFDLGAGSQTLKWTYLKNKSLARGQDRAWLDEVRLSPESPPAAPTGLLATPLSFNRIDLRWVDNAAEETAFNLEHSTNGIAFTRIATLGANVTAFAHNGVLSGTIHYYRVQAANGLGNSAYSEIVKAASLELTQARINFQPASAALPTGYLMDAGNIFADRANGLAYGWNVSNTSNSKDRNSPLSPDQRYDTYIPIAKSTVMWELAMPPALYDVLLVAGDPGDLNSDFRFTVEGLPALSGRPTTTNRWMTARITVPVLDGRLTVSNATGAVNNKLCFIDVTRRGPLLGAPVDKSVEFGSAWNFDPPLGAVSVCSGSNLVITVASTVTNSTDPCAFQATRTWNVSGACAMTNVCRQTVTVLERPAPKLVCAPDRHVEWGVLWTFELPASAGAVSIAVVSTVTNVLCGNSVSVHRTWSALDACGNLTTCAQRITVSDSSPPALACAADRIVEAGIPWLFDAPITGWPGDTNVVVSIVETITNALCGRSLVARRTWSATDPCGNSNGCVQVITVTDSLPPVILCGPNRFVECGTAWDFDAPAAIDLAEGIRIALSVLDTVTNRACGNALTATRRWSATDACGHRAECSQAITLVDTTPPVLLCGDIVTCDPARSVWPRVIDAGDPNPQLSCVRSDGLSLIDTFPNGSTMVNCIALDQCGNSNGCAFTVTLSAPLLGSGPADQTVLPGSDVVFATSVNGAGPFTYFWRFNGGPIEGAQGASLTLTNVWPGAAGNYCVEIAGPCQAVTNCATLVVAGESLEFCTVNQAFYADTNSQWQGLPLGEVLTNLLGSEPLLLGKPGVRSVAIGLDELPSLVVRLPAMGLGTNLPVGVELIFALLPVEVSGKLDNAFLGETITLALNARLNPGWSALVLTPVICTRAGDTVQSFPIPHAVLAALSDPAIGVNDPTLAGLLELAQRALAGLLTEGPTLAEIGQAVASVNAAFDGCRSLVTCNPAASRQ